MTTLLIVDDERQNLSALLRDISDQNPEWILLSAENEKDAFQLIDDNVIDVVITDLVMETDHSGIDILTRAKSKSMLTMVILITAYEKHLDRYRAFELGAFDCIQKNTPGIVASEEIQIKARAALRFRDLSIRQIEHEARLASMKRYFDPRVFGLIKSNPELLSLRLDTVTICFWDIRGFSKLCESLKAHPPVIADFLKQYFEMSANVIFEGHGVLDKFIGDGVMGLFGALEHNNDQGRQGAELAIRASVALMRGFEDLVRRWAAEWPLYTAEKVDIGLGCGIHTGDVLVGNVGTTLRDQFTALGPDVNLAARIEARSNKGQILLSASTHARVKEKFGFSEAGTINDVKNIPGEFQLYSIEVS